MKKNYFLMTDAYNIHGEYIGDKETAETLWKKGIAPELIDSSHTVCSIGFCKKEKKWYGWSRNFNNITDRALHGFKIGDVVKRGDCCASSGYTEEYLKKHPHEDKSLPIGFKAKTLTDCKKMAIAFAKSVA